MRQGADPGEADGELAVVRVGEADTGGLDEKAEPLGVSRTYRSGVCGGGTENGREVLVREDRLV